MSIRNFLLPLFTLLSLLIFAQFSYATCTHVCTITAVNQQCTAVSEISTHDDLYGMLSCVNHCCAPSPEGHICEEYPTGPSLADNLIQLMQSSTEIGVFPSVPAGYCGEEDRNALFQYPETLPTGEYQIDSRIRNLGFNSQSTDSSEIITVVEAEESTDLVGDSNCDGNINLMDAVLIQRYDVSLISAVSTCTELTDNTTTINQLTCDINGDEKCGLVDVLIIKQCNSFLENLYCSII